MAGTTTARPIKPTITEGIPAIISIVDKQNWRIRGDTPRLKPTEVPIPKGNAHIKDKRDT